MKRVVGLVAAVVAGLSGCASPARYVERSGDVGVVAIPANTDAWPTRYRSEAIGLIRKHVGPDFEIVEEKEVAVGTRTNNNQQVNREQTFNSAVPFLPAEKQTVTNSTTTTDVTEWRIAYRRKPAPEPMMHGAAPGSLMPAGGTTVQTQYVSPNAPQSSVTPTGYNQKLSQFDTGCKG
jgi:hypothetical protein